MHSSLASLATKKGEKRSLDEKKDLEQNLKNRKIDLESHPEISHTKIIDGVSICLNTYFDEDKINLLINQLGDDVYIYAKALHDLLDHHLLTPEIDGILQTYPKYASSIVRMCLCLLPENKKILDENLSDLLSDPEYAGKAAGLLYILKRYNAYPKYRDFVMQHRRCKGLDSALNAFLKADCLDEKMKFLEKRLQYLDKMQASFLLLMDYDLADEANLSLLFKLIKHIPIVITTFEPAVNRDRHVFLVNNVIIRLTIDGLLTQENLNNLFTLSKIGNEDFSKETLHLLNKKDISVVTKQEILTNIRKKFFETLTELFAKKNFLRELKSVPFTKDYIENILAKKQKTNANKLAELNLTEEEAKAFEKFKDPITDIIMEIPLVLREQIYDFSTIVKFHGRDIYRKPFHPFEVTTSRQTLNEFDDTIKEILKKRAEAKLAASSAKQRMFDKTSKEAAKAPLQLNLKKHK